MVTTPSSCYYRSPFPAQCSAIFAPSPTPSRTIGIVIQRAMSARTIAMKTMTSAHTSTTTVSLALPTTSITHTHALAVPSPIATYATIFAFIPAIARTPSPATDSDSTVNTTTLSRTMVETVNRIADRPSLPTIPTGTAHATKTVMSTNFAWSSRAYAIAIALPTIESSTYYLISVPTAAPYAIGSPTYTCRRTSAIHRGAKISAISRPCTAFAIFSGSNTSPILT